MLEEICQQVMGWFASRRHSDDLTIGPIVSEVATQIQILKNDFSRRYCFQASTEERFEMTSPVTLAEYIVHMDVQTCSCRRWQTKVYPVNSHFNRRDTHVPMLLRSSQLKIGTLKAM
jgi:hypothetical protein